MIDEKELVGLSTEELENKISNLYSDANSIRKYITCHNIFKGNDYTNKYYKVASTTYMFIRAQLYDRDNNNIEFIGFGFNGKVSENENEESWLDASTKYFASFPVYDFENNIRDNMVEITKEEFLNKFNEIMDSYKKDCINRLER